MKIIYLDQNRWIDLARAANSRSNSIIPKNILSCIQNVRRSGHACFPLSYAHYVETRKSRGKERRARLARFMLELSDGLTVAPPVAVILHEIEVSLSHCFAGRVTPQPFEYLGQGLTRASLNRAWELPPTPWPPGADQWPTSFRDALEKLYRSSMEHGLLSGTSPLGTEFGPLTDLTAERNFKASLERWRGAQSRYGRVELEREISESNFSDIEDLLLEVLARYEISIDEFQHRGGLQGKAFLEDMPYQRADMHLKLQWAKNANLRPRDSDLVDWSFLNSAISYCDVVVTEKQMADLYSRGLDTRATVIAQWRQLPELLVNYSQADAR